MQQQEYKEIYRQTMEQARLAGEIQLWRASYEENQACARAIEKAISERYENNHLSADIAKRVIEEYGYDRVNWVLANTVREGKSDGRYSAENKKWSQLFQIPTESEHRNSYYAMSSHPCLVDGVIDQARKAWQALGLYDYSHCYEENMDYRCRVVAIRPEILKDEYKTPEDQIFYARSGFGCKPDALGTKVFGYFLKDGAEAWYRRGEIIGIVRPEYLPDWVREKLEKLTYEEAENKAEEQPKDVGMGGIT